MIRRWRFFLAFGALAVLIAGALSYLADPDPDGLDSVSRQGCTVEGGQLAGECIAREARDHPLEGGPLSGYRIGGDEALTGVAGVLGVLATLVVAGALFRWLASRAPKP